MALDNLLIVKRKNNVGLTPKPRIQPMVFFHRFGEAKRDGLFKISVVKDRISERDPARGGGHDETHARPMVPPQNQARTPGKGSVVSSGSSRICDTPSKVR